MPLSDAELQALRFVPDLTTDPVDQVKEGIFKDEMIARVGLVPYDQTPFPGQVLAVQGNGSSFTVAAENTGPIGFGLQAVRRFRPHALVITGSVALTDNSHCGSWLLFAPTSPMNVTIGLSVNPASGVGEYFQINMLRLFGASEVTIVFGGGLTNRQSSGFARLDVAKVASVFVVDNDAYMSGGLKA